MPADLGGLILMGAPSLKEVLEDSQLLPSALPRLRVDTGQKPAQGLRRPWRHLLPGGAQRVLPERGGDARWQDAGGTTAVRVRARGERSLRGREATASFTPA